MKNKLIKLSFVMSALLCAFSVNAAATSAAPVKANAASDIPLPLQLALQGGLKVEKQFKAAGGLTGWILSEGPGRNMVAFTSADGEVAIAGNMLSAKGENLTKKYLEQYGPKIDYDKYWSKLESSAYVAEGAKGKDAKQVLYVFMDPNCGYCHLAWRAFLSYEKVGLQVRWIPVAFLAPDSAAKAAALISAKNGDAALAELHANFGKKTQVPEASKELKAKIDANTKLMAEMGFRGTPATLYKDKSGKVLAVDGMPRLGQLPEITGLPEQKIDDPELARFRN